MRSQVRDSDIQNLFLRVQENNYGQYLSEINIAKLRGLQNQMVRFDFPVTALIGINGSGKSTILVAAALLYRNQQPIKHFPKGGDADNSMQDWKVTHLFLDKSIRPTQVIERSARFKNAKWQREVADRQVLYFGINRAVPIVEQVEFSKYAKSKAIYQVNNIDDLISSDVKSILGKANQQYNTINSGKIHSATLQNGKYYSEFNFGAGKSSILRMVKMIQSAGTNSLILIEEIENGLHPVATKKLVEYLIRQAIEKSIQVIFTTHNQAALDFLPSKAVWAITEGQAKQGILDIQTLYVIEGVIDKDIVIYCEDSFSKLWIEGIIATEEDLIRRCEVHQAGGDTIAKKIHLNNRENPATEGRYKSICYLDGDSSYMKDESNDVYALPGQHPEFTVFDQVLENWDHTSVILQVALTGSRSHLTLDKLYNKLMGFRRSCNDHHFLFSMIGQDLLQAKNIVESAFIKIWVQHFELERNKILSTIRSSINS